MDNLSYDSLNSFIDQTWIPYTFFDYFSFFNLFKFVCLNQKSASSLFIVVTIQYSLSLQKHSVFRFGIVLTLKYICTFRF